MIRLEVTGDTAEEFLKNLFAVSAAMQQGGGQTTITGSTGLDNSGSTDTPKPATRGRGKKQETAADGPAPGDAAAAQPEAGPTNDTTAPVTREEVAKKATQYAMPGKGGPAALQELLIKHGSTTGKWSALPDESLPALSAELDGLLG